MTDIRYIEDADNAPADALSRNITTVTSSSLDYVAIALDQSGDAEMEKLLKNTALLMKKITPPATKVALYADVFTAAVRPYMLKRHRYLFFHQLHDLSPWYSSLAASDDVLYRVEGYKQRRQAVGTHLHRLPSLLEEVRLRSH